MPVTTTIIPSDGLTESERMGRAQLDMKHAMVRPAPPINERPTEIERKPLKSSRPAAALVKQVRTSLTNALAKEAGLKAKQARLDADKDRHSALMARQGKLAALSQNAEAEAILADTSADTAELQAKLEAVADELRGLGNIGAIDRAKAMVDSEIQAAAAQITKLKKELASAEQSWIALRHAELTEDFRHDLHALHRRLAVILALEETPGFPSYKANAWKFIEGVRTGVPYVNELFPDWANSVERKAFPRFADAKAQIRAKLDTLDGDE
jgi:chromosome segregation ATPase